MSSVANDELIQALLNAKTISQPRNWTFVWYTPEKISSRGANCYNEINFERRNYWYPNRPTLPTLDDQVLDWLPKLENGSQTSQSDNSLDLSEFSIDLGGYHCLPMMRSLEVRRLKMATLKRDQGYPSVLIFKNQVWQVRKHFFEHYSCLFSMKEY